MRLTLPQQDIYFDQLLFPNEPIYNIGAKIEINGHINIEVFQKAYIELINQHDAYRSVFINEQDNVTVKIIKAHNSELGFVDFSKSEKPCVEANTYMQQEFSKPFVLLGESPLHVFTMVKVEEDFHYLFSIYHHIITDGWGTSLMFQRLVQNYNEIYQFGKVTSDYKFSYQDFVKDDHMYQNSESYKTDLKYWSEKFNSLPENLIEKRYENERINSSRRKELIINRGVYNQLNLLAARHKCSTFHLVLGILYTYFGRKYENDDFAIGLPVLNRSKATYKKTVGLFMGISPLRMVLDFDNTFEALLNDIKNQLRQDYRHQRMPLGKLIKELQLFKEKERLFNITLSYEKQNYSSDFLHTQTKVIPLSHQSERVPLAVYIREFDESEDVKIDFDYNLNYFNETDITQVVNHFEKLIEEVLTNSIKKLRELQYLTENEIQELQFNYNATKVSYPKDKTILDLFQEQVKQKPRQIALKDDINSYSYAELDILSNHIASYIIAKYIRDDNSPIAVLLDRSANLIAVLVAILKTGRSFIPLDPSFPKDRLSYIVQNSQCTMIISEKEYKIDKIEGITLLTLENILAEVDEDKDLEIQIASPQDTAYIIYTSGSTGNPKGVEIGHQSLLNFLISMQQEPGFTSKDILFSVTTYSFDISLLEFFIPLISGGILFIASQEVLSDVSSIIKKIEEIKPTVIQATPSFFQMLFNDNWQGDKQLKVMCGGDLLSEALAEKLINLTLEVWNMYGPTETTIWSSCKKIECSKDAFNIGKPINNTQFYILDRFLNLKPSNIFGALYIAGDGLSKGYYKNEALTLEKFIKNPFDKNSLLYETGDLGKWNSKGEIEFLGRNDNQIKIRGYRIELGDVETQLNLMKEIENSVVIAKKGEQQDAFLVAYIIKNKKFTDISKILNQLRLILPYYMIPYVIIALEEFPLTPNQKVDRKWLSQRDIQQSLSTGDYREPVSELEIKLSKFWREVLNVNDISVSANFFAFGGHSLNAVKLIGLIAKQLSLVITLKTIFDYPTIELLASYLQKLKTSQSITIPLSESKGFYGLTPPQYNIWLASQQKNGSMAYNMFAGYSVEGIVNLEKIVKSINNIINKYEILRTNFIEIDGIPFQKINSFEKVRFEISIHRLKSKKVGETINQLINTAFDLEKDLLIRVQLLQLETNQFKLVFSTHHIIMDGLSLEVFIKEFIENYNESAFLDTSKVNTLKFQFKDYSEWLNRTLEDNTVKNELFWKNYLQNYRPKDSFDRDFDNKENLQRGSEYLFELPLDTTSALKKLAFEEQVTFYTILVAALNVLIYKLSNHNDICIGTVSSGRNIPELNNQIGMFVKTLVLRSQIGSDQTFVDILKSTKNNLLEINDYQDVPFDKVSQYVFDIMLVYQNPEFSFENNVDFNDFNLTAYPINNKYSRMPIVFNLFESDNRLKGIIDYNVDLFEKDTIQIIALKYSKLLNEIIKNPTIEIDLIDTKLEFEKNTAFDFDFNF